MPLDAYAVLPSSRVRIRDISADSSAGLVLRYLARSPSPTEPVSRGEMLRVFARFGVTVKDANRAIDLMTKDELLETGDSHLNLTERGVYAGRFLDLLEREVARDTASRMLTG